MLLADQQADRGPARQTPILANELKFSFDVIDQQGHVPVQIKVGHFKDQWVAEHGHSADAVNLQRQIIVQSNISLPNIVGYQPTLLVPREPTGRGGLPVRPILSFTPNCWYTFISWFEDQI